MSYTADPPPEITSSGRRESEASADAAVVRTDYLDRDRFRFRGTWEPTKWFRVGGTAEKVPFTA